MFQRALLMVGLGLAGALALVSAGRPVMAADVCSTRHSNADLKARLDEGEATFVALDDQGFTAALHEANLVLRCLSEPIAPVLATRLHWMNGLQLYLQEDPQRAAFALAAARTGGARFQVSPEVLPKGHELWALYEDQTSEPEEQQQPPPREGTLFFDGVAGTARPIDRATVVQLRLPDSSIKLSRYVLPGQGLPDYGAMVPSPELARGRSGNDILPPTRQQRVRRRAVNPWLAVGTGLAAAGATTALLLADNARSQFLRDDPGYSFEDLQAMQNQANRRGAAGVVLGAGSVGLGVSAVFVGVWQ